jgi:cytochrome b involved in lipid metabolism
MGYNIKIFMKKQFQHGFIPLLVILITLLSLGGVGTAAYQVRKHNKELQSQKSANIQVTEQSQKKPEEVQNTPSQEVKKVTPAQSQTVKNPVKVVAKKSTTRYENDDEEEGEDDNRSTSTTTPVVKPSTTPSATATAYTLADVKTHNTRTSCWTAVNGAVYDVTSWISQHPGGSQTIIGMCGIDASSAYDGQHGGASRPASELVSFKIGVLK